MRIIFAVAAGVAWGWWAAYVLHPDSITAWLPLCVACIPIGYMVSSLIGED